MSKRVIAIAFTLAAFLVGPADPRCDDSTEAWATLLDLEIAARILEIHLDELPDAIPDEWTSLAESKKTLPPELAKRLPLRDGWGRPLVAAQRSGQLVLVSAGPDGVPDTVERLAGESSVEDDPVKDIRSMLGDDMVLVPGEPVYNAPQTERSRQKRTMADLRSVGTAIESYSIDHNAYPVQLRGLLGVESIREHLEPLYIRRVPLLDAWGRPLLCWSYAQGYILVSAGADGLLDREWDEPTLSDPELVGETEGPNEDIVFSNGSFVRWPAGVAQ